MSSDSETDSNDQSTSIAKPTRTNGEFAVSFTNVNKSFRVGFLKKKVQVLHSVSFNVPRGEAFGLLGPNGAGKTTSIKCLLKLVHIDGGQITIFGNAPGSRDASSHIGYMPENPYIYRYLTPLEFLDLCGRLLGMSANERIQKSEALLERVTLTHAKDRPIGKFSKGMMQRVGLAQALLNDAAILILDEPMSGLDPLGRKAVRDILLEEKAKGKTLIFTSHILNDVQAICDRVALMAKGKVAEEISMADLMSKSVRGYEVELKNVDTQWAVELLSRLGTKSELVTQVNDRVLFNTDVDLDIDKLLTELKSVNGSLVGLIPHRPDLEEAFVSLAEKDK